MSIMVIVSIQGPPMGAGLMSTLQSVVGDAVWEALAEEGYEVSNMQVALGVPQTPEELIDDLRRESEGEK